MTEIWRDDAPGERRAALFEHGEIVEIYIQRDLHRVLGQCGSGLVDRKVPSGTYLACDDGGELLVRGKTARPDGSRICFEVTREAICEPGRCKPAEARLLDDMIDAPSKDDLWERLLGGLGYEQRNSNIASALDIAMAGASTVGDVTVSFQRTKVGLVFDVDGVGDPLAVNLAAAREIARLLRLYQVGGMAMVDFVAVASKDARQKIADAFDEAAAADPRDFERSAVNGFGLMQVVRARPRPSVLDQLFGTRIASLSDETLALGLLREAASSSGFGPRVITAKTAIANLLASNDWGRFRETCERQTGASLAVVADDAVSGYGHVHVAQS
ncbi:MAG TPA: ribonuclease E/G [Sphingorhabdus sp.]|nr:ribonuclease E/G [Sphingorhabdus sp.]